MSVIHCVSGLDYEVIERGPGDETPGPEDVVEVRMNGEQRTLRVDEVGPGLAEALQLMTVGGKVRAWIPPRLSAGEPSPVDLELLSFTRTRDYPALPVELTSPRDPEEDR